MAYRYGFFLELLPRERENIFFLFSHASEDDLTPKKQQTWYEPLFRVLDRLQLKRVAYFVEALPLSFLLGDDDEAADCYTAAAVEESSDESRDLRALTPRELALQAHPLLLEAFARHDLPQLEEAYPTAEAFAQAVEEEAHAHLQEKAAEVPCYHLPGRQLTGGIAFVPPRALIPVRHLAQAQEPDPYLPQARVDEVLASLGKAGPASAQPLPKWLPLVATLPWGKGGYSCTVALPQGEVTVLGQRKGEVEAHGRFLLACARVLEELRAQA